MADADVESVEGKKLRQATIERMVRRWRQEVPFPRRHLERVMDEGDAGVFSAFFDRENSYREAHPPIAAWLAMMDMRDTHRAIRDNRPAQS